VTVLGCATRSWATCSAPANTAPIGATSGMPQFTTLPAWL
jgi:hypothetical protein